MSHAQPPKEEEETLPAAHNGKVLQSCSCQMVVTRFLQRLCFVLKFVLLLFALHSTKDSGMGVGRVSTVEAVWLCCYSKPTAGTAIPESGPDCKELVKLPWTFT